jgi:hypothetical protein
VPFRRRGLRRSAALATFASALALCSRGVIALTAFWNHKEFVALRESMKLIDREAHRTYLRS